MKSHPVRISLSRPSANKRRRWLIASIVLLALPLTALENAQGAAFQINSTTDEDDAAPGDGICQTVASGVCTLRAAIQEANAFAGNDSIGFAIPTTDPGFDPEAGRHTINLSKGLPGIVTDIEINGPGPDKLTVRRNTGGSYVVFQVTQQAAGVVSLSGMTITRGYGDLGGGIFNAGLGSTLNVTNCTVSGNSGANEQGGGGIRNFGDLNVTNCTLSGNRGGVGGGIQIGGGTVNIINSTITGNAASADGGGIWNAASGPIKPKLNITNSTISGNSARRGGGVYNGIDGTATFKSSIIALNTADQNPDLGGHDNTYTSQGFNLIGDADNSGFIKQTTDQTGTSLTPLDAKLDPNGLQNNGGPTQTIALLFGSPAIDKGTSDGLSGVLSTDQRSAGFPRTFDNSAKPNPTGGDGTDIGAFEVQSSTSTPGLSTLANISTRSLVQTGDNVLIAGFIVVGSNPRKVIIRAIGPSLPFAGVLADPTLELRDANGGLIRANDNWRTAGQESEIIATTIPPTNDLEPAIVATVSANNSNYTAIVRGVGNTTGIAVVEVYALP